MTDVLMVLADADADDTTFGLSNANVESQFAEVLENFQLHDQTDPFQVIREFKSICAKKALDLSTQLSDESLGASNNTNLQFENWELETRLWHLVEILYSYRFSDFKSLYPEFPFSSFYVKRENWLTSNPKIKELSLIIHWLQENTRSISVSSEDFENTGKWQNTRIKLENKDLNILANNQTSSNATEVVDQLDVDAPLRSGKSIDSEDDSSDSKIFSVIYKLVLSNDINEAIQLANDTGNFTLALILVGAQQDFIDPLVDKETLLNSVNNNDDMLIDDINSATNNKSKSSSGIKHKLLWIKTVYKLSQQQNLNPYEKLIYTYLSGNDINSNLKASSNNWEEHLTLYLNQLFTYKLEEFITSSMTETEKQEELISFPTITPQSTNVNGILNFILNSDNDVSEQSKHPIRVILGSIMIDQVANFLTNEIKSATKNKNTLSQNPYILRIITHLSIFLLMIEGEASEANKNVSKIIALYVSKLQDAKYIKLIPIYLSFIPNEKDARECYSLFLSSITDPIQRTEQISIAKKFNKFNNLLDDSESVSTSTDSNIEPEDKLANVLRRTVERVMSETEPHYRPHSYQTINVDSDINNINPIDEKIYKSVEWFFDSNMYEDAISASIIVFRRFLLNGKLASVKKFCDGKNFKSLIKDYDAEHQIKLFNNSDLQSSVTEEMKEEILQYNLFNETLNLIDDWKSFLINNQTHNSSINSLWKSKDVEKSIEKTTSQINDVIYSWFQSLINSSSINEQDQILFKEFRTIYVPYLIFELLTIHQISRLNNWKYISDAFKLISEVAKDNENDFLNCFIKCGRLNEFVKRCGEIAIVASENGIQGIFRQ